MAYDLELDGATPSTNGAPRRRSGGRLPHQLPSGRHGLPRDFVEKNQRERILRAVVEVASETGYGALTVRDVIEAAGVSRRTFYDHFDNKEEAFLAAYHLVVGRLAVDVEESSSKGSTWCESILFGLSTFLDIMARDAAMAHLLVVEVLAAGPPALASRAAAMEAFRGFLEPGFDEAPEGLPVPALAAGPEAIARRNGAMAAFATLISDNARTIVTPLEPPPLTAETIVGGIYEVVYTRIVRGDIRQLPELLADLLYPALLPYEGKEAAVSEYQRVKGELAAEAK